jgi:hypothetical protein
MGHLDALGVSLGTLRFRQYIDTILIIFSVQTGPAIFLNQHTALEMTLGYTYLSRGPIDTTVTNKLQVGIGLQVHIGKH